MLVVVRFEGKKRDFRVSDGPTHPIYTSVSKTSRVTSQAHQRGREAGREEGKEGREPREGH